CRSSARFRSCLPFVKRPIAASRSWRRGPRASKRRHSLRLPRRSGRRLRHRRAPRRNLCWNECMATPKPQIRSLFATPVCQHFHPIATEANAELRPIIIEKAQAEGSVAAGQGWRSAPDFESWGGAQVEHLLRVVRELADSLTATRAGARINVDWKV